LVRGKRVHGYPRPVEDLASFLVLNKQYWPLVAQYLWEVPVSYTVKTREAKFRFLLTMYLSSESCSPADVARLWSLLQELYQLASRKLEPRGRFLEFFVYRIGPFTRALRDDPHLCREYQCSLHERLESSISRSLVDSDATFDAAFLGVKCFEGHECKAQVKHFLSYHKPTTEWRRNTRNKLEFIVDTTRQAKMRGLTSQVFLTGLDRECEKLERCLQSHGYGEIKVLGPDDIDELLSSVQ
jgi:hypothetical protein